MFDIKPLQKLTGKKKTIKKVKSILNNLGGRNTEGVAGGKLTWEYTSLQTGQYACSLQNNLREPVKEIYCLVIFYDRVNDPIDIDIIRYRGIIPGILAKRVTSKVDGSVQKLTTLEGYLTAKTKIEFRILDFQIVEESEDEF